MPQTAEKPDSREAMYRKLTLVYTTLIPVLFGFVAVCVREIAPYNALPLWLLLILALLAGAATGLLAGFLVKVFLNWLWPTLPDPRKSRIAILALGILAFLISLGSWRDGRSGEHSYTSLAIETGVMFFALIFLVLAFLIIYRVLGLLFGLKRTRAD